jgi:hypothetical protein
MSTSRAQHWYPEQHGRYACGSRPRGRGEAAVLVALADLDEGLRQADPLFHLWHGLDDETRDKPVNEKRYGPWTWFEAMSRRFAALTRPEVEAIVAYLRYKAERDELARPMVEQALRNFWLVRLG